MLNGALANALGSEFQNYVILLPPIERVWISTADWRDQVTGIGGNLATVFMISVALMVSAALGTYVRVKTIGAGPGFFLASFFFLLAAPIFYKNMFGLREHMVILGLWPWLVMRAAPLDVPDVGRRLRFAIGLWMGVMLTFKYLYCLVVMFVELVDASVQRDFRNLFRIENLAAGTV